MSNKQRIDAHRVKWELSTPCQGTKDASSALGSTVLSTVNYTIELYNLLIEILSELGAPIASLPHPSDFYHQPAATTPDDPSQSLPQNIISRLLPP